MLSRYVSPRLWIKLIRSIAVDASDRLFLTDGQTVFAIKDGVPSIYLTAAAIQDAMGVATIFIIGIDTDSEGSLFLAVSGASAAGFIFTTARILVSSAVDTVAPLYELPPAMSPTNISVISRSKILVVDGRSTARGLYAVGGDGAQMLYDQHAANWNGDCGAYAFSATSDGFFFYLAGCGGNLLLGGRDDGSGVGVLPAQTTNLDRNLNFVGLGSDGSDAAIVNAGDFFYHVDQAGNYSKLSVSPPPSKVAASDTGAGLNGFSIRNVAITTTHTCTIFVAVPEGFVYQARPQ